jgi:hypothetical protein
MNSKRHNLKWNTNELIALQREYELLDLSIQEIANRHQRSINAILCKLEKENFISTWCDAKGFENYVKDRPELNYYVRDDIYDDGLSEYCDLDDLDDLDDDSEFETQISSDYDITTQLKNIGLIIVVKQIIEYIQYLIKLFSYNTKSITPEI